MQKKIYGYAEMFKNNNMLSQAKEYEQIYAIIISLFDKVVSILGDEVMSLKEYKKILQAGFDSIKVGIIPPGLDTIMVGDIERTRLKDTKKVIFFIGVNDGIIPATGVGGGIITDSDREFLQEKNFILAPTARENIFKQKVYLYSLLAKPTEKICISYSKSASDGSVRRKSYLISTIQKMFPKINIKDVIIQETDINKITNKSFALRYTAQNMRDYCFNKNSKVEQLSAILLKDSKCREKMMLIMEGALYKKNNSNLKKEIASSLYGIKDNIGITRIEKYAACAYAQFLSNGLKLGERKKFEIAAFDIGNLYHNAINNYFIKVQEKNIEWNTLDTNKSHEIINECVEKVMEEYDNDAINITARALFIKNQVRETATKTVDVLVKHIQAGKFIPAEYELRVDHGRIDRVDILKYENKLYVKVIDYKSGNKKFSISDVYLGLQLQLMVYLKDAIEYQKKKNPGLEVIPAAGLYFHVHNPYIPKPNYDKMISEYRNKYPEIELDDDTIKEDAVYNEQYKLYRMSGMVNSDTDVMRLMDKDIFEAIGKSDILPVQSTRSGLSSRSTVMTGNNYMKFVDFISNKANKMREQIMEGNIDINPVEGACDYCPYGSVCGFDRKLGDKYREIKKVSLEEVTERMNFNVSEILGEDNDAVDR